DRCFAALAAWHLSADAAVPRASARRSSENARGKAEALLGGNVGAPTEGEAKQVLTAYGVPVVQGTVATSAEGAVAAAEAFGYPVVLKIESAAIAHKTEAGGVRVNLGSASDVKAAYSEILSNARKVTQDIAGVSVQPM